MSGINAFFAEDKKDISNAIKLNFMNLIGYIKKSKQVFIAKKYFHCSFNHFKNSFFHYFLPNFGAKFRRKQNLFLLFWIKRFLKSKKLRKLNHSEIKFYNMECDEFRIGNKLTQISQNFDFPCFQLFQIFAQ